MNIPVREGETIEGSRTTRNRPYPVLKCSSGRVRRTFRRELELSATSVPLALVLRHVDTWAPTQLSIVLEGLLNELGIANLSTFEAVLKHDTGAVLDAIRSTAAAAEAGAAAYASSATSNVVVSPGSYR